MVGSIRGPINRVRFANNCLMVSVIVINDDTVQPLIVDVRTEDEFAAGRIPGAVNIPLSEVVILFSCDFPFL